MRATRRRFTPSCKVSSRLSRRSCRLRHTNGEHRHRGQRRAAFDLETETCWSRTGKSRSSRNPTRRARCARQQPCAGARGRSRRLFIPAPAVSGMVCLSFVSSAGSSRGRRPERARELKAEVFNLPAWEEAILFAVERMARGDERPAAAACGKAILAAFEVDPILAAEMIFRATDEVWAQIADDHSEARGALARARKMSIAPCVS